MPKSVASRETKAPSGPRGYDSKLINLLALILIRDRKQTEQIDLLHRVGFQSAEIAALLGTTRNTVSVQISVNRRGRPTASGKKSKR